MKKAAGPCPPPLFIPCSSLQFHERYPKTSLRGKTKEKRTGSREIWRRSSSPHSPSVLPLTSLPLSLSSASVHSLFFSPVSLVMNQDELAWEDKGEEDW